MERGIADHDVGTTEKVEPSKKFKERQFGGEEEEVIGNTQMRLD
jgi:hypothetical protein